MSMTLIQTVTVGSGGAATIDFTSIPATFTDLVCKFSLRTSHASVTSYQFLSFNGSTSGFSIRALGGQGSSAFSYTTPSNFGGENVGNNATASTFGSGELYITNYTASSNKSFSIDSVGENNATTAQQALVAGLWSNSSPLTSITMTPLSGIFLQHSTATLYGITSGSSGGVIVS